VGGLTAHLADQLSDSCAEAWRWREGGLMEPGKHKVTKAAMVCSLRAMVTARALQVETIHQACLRFLTLTSPPVGMVPPRADRLDQVPLASLVREFHEAEREDRSPDLNRLEPLEITRSLGAGGSAEASERTPKRQRLLSPDMLTYPPSQVPSTWTPSYLPGNAEVLDLEMSGP